MGEWSTSLAFSIIVSASAFVVAAMGVARALALMRRSQSKNSVSLRIRKEGGETVEFTGENLNREELEHILYLLSSDSTAEKDQRSPDDPENSPRD